MKVLFSKPVGGDGATIQASIDDNNNLVLGATYPLAKITGPGDQVLDNVTQKIESALGNAGWAKAILDPLDAAAKAELASLLGGG